MSDRVISHELLCKVVDWDVLGIYLGLDENEIVEIERDYQSNARRRIEMLAKWMNKDVDASWRKVIDALGSMSQVRLAKQLMEKYTTDAAPGHCIESSEIELTVDKEAKVVREIEALGEKYIQLVMKAESAVEEANPSPKKLKRFLQYHKKPEVKTVEELDLRPCHPLVQLGEEMP